MKHLTTLIREAHDAAPSLSLVAPETVERVLEKTADNIIASMDFILEENRKDLANKDSSHPDYDRLRLTPERIEGIAEDMRSVARMPVPYGKVISETVRPNGMVIRKVTVPFGVIGVIYESRPNVTADVFGLCLRSGSACVLKGGHEALNSTKALVEVIHSTLREFGLPEALCTRMPPSRDSATAMMEAAGLIDVIIPRGGRGLIDYVRGHSLVPVIETGAGVCHTYIDATASVEKSANVVCNAKTRRVSVCNALDCLIIHRSRLSDLPEIVRPLAEKNVEIYADRDSYMALEGKYPADLLNHADGESFGREYLDYKMSVKTVGSVEEAMSHISRYGSHHSECIMSEDADSITKFQTGVDAACVYANVSTAFTDGAQFGMGAEIGISTQKLHARGPMALQELTTYKYLITGEGQTRGC